MDIKIEAKNDFHNIKKDIIKVARRLFSEDSYLGVSMSDIAKKLNITKAALYYHFTGKTEIYQETLKEAFCNINLKLKKSLDKKTDEEKLRSFIKNYLDVGLKEKNLIKALVAKLSSENLEIQNYIIKSKNEIIKFIRPIIKKILKNKNLPKNIDSNLITFFLINMMDGLLLEYSFLKKRIDSKKISNQIVNIMFKNI